MKLLLLGFSRIARRRILPALSRMGIDELEIASVSAGSIGMEPSTIPPHYRTYEDALERSQADLVYISTLNSLHAPLAIAALRRGFHVIVDKPACLSLDEARQLADAAASSGKCLAEATVWAYHPQVQSARDLFSGSATRILAAFSFPPLPPSASRYRAEWGGGAENDVGPYALTPARCFFGEPVAEVDARVLTESCGVIASFAILSHYSKGRCLTGFFGFDTSYINQLQIFGLTLGISMDRVFSPPADLPLQLSVRQEDRARIIEVPAADSFELFLREVFAAIRRGEYDHFCETLVSDASEREVLRMALARSRQSSV